MAKKGISPLIATVLLIVFALAIGTIVLSWSTSYTSTTTEKVDESSAELMECTKAGIKIDAVFASGDPATVDRIHIRNTGQIPIEVTGGRISSAESSATLNAPVNKLAVGGIGELTADSTITCDAFANARVTTSCGTVSATHSNNETIIGCNA